MAHKRLTPAMRRAITVWEQRDPRYDYGVVNAQGTDLFGGQPWIHWRTAAALERRGLAKVTGEGDACQVVIQEQPRG